MQSRNNFHANQTDFQETNFAAYIFPFLINKKIVWLVPKKDWPIWDVAGTSRLVPRQDWSIWDNDIILHS